MLYVFHVDTGRMLTFDMNIAVETVDVLKDAINRNHRIPKQDQVLLVSGGETLQSDARVGRYSAGTDTNPIFMFSKTITDARNPPPPWPSIESDNELKAQVERCLDLPPTYNTVVTRATLAQQLYEMAREEYRICDKLVMEQHLQQQGWCAVVANLEDLTVDFQERCDVFFRGFKEHLEKRDDYRTYLSDFNDDLIRLSKIPILPALVQNAEEKRFSAFDDVYQDQAFNNSGGGGNAAETTGTKESGDAKESGDVTDEKEPDEKDRSTSSEKKSSTLSLLQWISVTENQRSLRKMAENCAKELEMFDEKTANLFQTEIDTAVAAANREDMKEIKGLEDRLQGLEKLMREARKHVQDQNEMATAFQQNQLRAANLGDTSILPDLCASHRSQLLVMLSNHKNLRDIRRRCAKAKDELGHNLFQRLTFIIKIENVMWEIDSRLLFYHNCLRRLQKHLNIIEQIHQAPTVYVTAVTEVVRRREFSNAFLSWASELAMQLMTIYNDELVRRQEFAAMFEGHFLSTLFPGMNEMPPPFATEAPSVFDSSLPNLTKSDVYELSNQLPEFISKSSTFQEMEAVIGFFTQSRHQHRAIVSSAEKPPTVPTESQMLKPPDLHAHLKEYERGFESETDTEEFEKVSQSPIDRRSTVNVQSSSQSNAPVILATPAKLDITTSTYSVEMQSVETLTDENYETIQSEVTRLKELLTRMQEISMEKIRVLREQLVLTQEELVTSREEMKQDIGSATKTLTAMESEVKNRERELVQRLTVDHELEMNDIRMNVSSKDEEIQSLRSERIDMVAQHESEKCLLRDTAEKLTEEVAELKRRLEIVEADSKKELAEVKERLTREHKNEVELMRSRINLMKSIDRSPSDTSLEKIERPDMIDMVNHQIIVSQVKEDMMKEREAAIEAAVEQERTRQQQSSQTLLAESPRSSNPDFLRRMIEDRDKQLEVLREREALLVKENLKYRDTIQSLADSDITASNASAIQDMRDKFEQEKEALKHELAREKARQNRQVNVNMKSCSVGDLVLIVWNSTHGQYTIMQESSTLVFLNEASYPVLGLAYPTTGQFPTTLATLGYITDKEYCHARKEENRYKVAKGQKFYRVKCAAYYRVKGKSSTNTSSDRKSPVPGTSTASTVTLTVSEPVPVTATSRSTSTEMIASGGSTHSLSQSQRTSTTTLLTDSCAQTDLGPLMEQPDNDMVDSGMGSQQKSMCQSQRTTSEEIMTQLDEASATVDTSDEADGIQYGAASNLRYDIQTSITSTESSTNKCFDDEVVDDELESLSDEYRSLENKQEES